MPALIAIEDECPAQTPISIIKGAGEFPLEIVPSDTSENNLRRAVIINGLLGCEETITLSNMQGHGVMTIMSM
ncbi:MAG: hypothetical protein F6K25_31800 [Okeania sp. SIO2G4]|uniref:hypothetical protein n=1 Tax=unclassified Okeania TaxID=2634635 RepID=UPI0013B8E826|nr:MULTISPECIES: hypothetical protein [unclassified Okeania]NEP76056.1 hypothetical protein [Okeania sp. SIO2G5]NEP97239.1 hypothetical protein [Okeania sp. SIO2F5]NEQ94959.1 hypothetical protein [Okeania sp. SIO2G4]